MITKQKAKDIVRDINEHRSSRPLAIINLTKKEADKIEKELNDLVYYYRSKACFLEVVKSHMLPQRIRKPYKKRRKK
jgi:hypothetical protein